MDSEQKPRQYAQGWMDMMVTIWQEKIQEYYIYDTGALYQSFEKDLSKWTDDKDKGTIIHKFLRYGVYVDRGQGRKKSEENTLDNNVSTTRIPRPWLFKRYRYSVYRFGEYFARQYGEQFCRMIRKNLIQKAKE